MDDDNEQFARFEEMGEETVRIHVHTAGFSTTHQRLAIKWLQGKADESKRRNESAHLEQNRTDRTIKNAAIVAAFAAIITIIISTLAWIYPRHLGRPDSFPFRSRVRLAPKSESDQAVRRLLSWAAAPV